MNHPSEMECASKGLRLKLKVNPKDIPCWNWKQIQRHLRWNAKDILRAPFEIEHSPDQPEGAFEIDKTSSRITLKKRPHFDIEVKSRGPPLGSERTSRGSTFEIEGKSEGYNLKSKRPLWSPRDGLASFLMNPARPQLGGFLSSKDKLKRNERQAEDKLKSS